MNSNIKKYLFVGGLARSGTSALTELLNGHSEIAIGMERYKYLFGNGELFTRGEELFEKQKFFEWSPTETNVQLDDKKYQRMYERIERKYHQVSYHGTLPIYNDGKKSMIPFQR